MVKNVSGTYTLVPDASWQDLQTDEVRLLCDTSLAPVIINMPSIASLSGFWNVKIFIVDASQNAETNNITINAVGGNKIGSDTSEVINKNGGALEIQVLSSTNWLANSSAEMGGSGGNSTLLGYDITGISGVDASYHLEDNPTNEIIASGIGKAYAILDIKTLSNGDNLTLVSFPDLKELDGGAYFVDQFFGPGKLTSALFPALETMTIDTFRIDGMQSFTTADLSKLKKVVFSGVDTFNLTNLPLLTSLSFPALTDIESVLNPSNPSVFQIDGCATLSTVDLSKLVNADKNYFPFPGYVMVFQNLPLLTSVDLSSFVNGGTGWVALQANDIMPSISLPELISGGIAVDTCPLMVSISAPKLALGSVVSAVSNPLLPSFLFPLLSSAVGFGVQNNLLLTSVSVPLLASVTDTGTALQVTDNPILPSVAFPSLSYVGGTFTVQNNLILDTITLGAATLEFFNVNFSGNALTQVSVDDILNQLDVKGLTNNVITFDTPSGTFQVGETITGSISLATGVVVWNNGSGQLRVRITSGAFQLAETITGGTSLATGNTTAIDFPSLDLTGGTNATPSAAGLVSKANLVAKGWTVTTN
jgi:hypothetical protein